MKNKPYPLYPTPQISNLKELVSVVAEKYGNAHAFTFERKKKLVSISYNQFRLNVDALGIALFNLDIKNEKVAVIGENSYEWILTYFAVVNTGNVIVPLDRELPYSDIKSIIDNSESETFVYSDDFSDIAEYLQQNNNSVKRYINMKTFPELIDHGGELIRSGEIVAGEIQIDHQKLAALHYTSGTTGTAKGVMLTHLAIASNTLASCQYVGIFGSNMLVLPLHHTFSFTAGVCAMLLKGSEIFINSSLKHLLADLEKFKPSNMFLVPLFVETFYKKIWDGAKEQGKDKLLIKLITLSNALLKMGIDLRRLLFKSVLRSFGGDLKLIVSGGAPIDIKYIQGLRNLGINVLNGYGITECSPIVSVNRNQYYRNNSIGLVLTCCDVKILNPDITGHGEICVKGDIVMLGYYKNDQATKEAFEGEWFKTGDIGHLDEEGFLYISGRKKNLIILNNGKNVYPEELESALLNQISYIKEIVVYAENNIIVAEVFLDVENVPGCVSKLDDDILAFNHTQAPYKNIGKTVIRNEEFPKTTTKKIKRQYK